MLSNKSMRRALLESMENFVPENEHLIKKLTLKDG